MSTKMKGLLKGLRYISQIFDNEKEQQQQDMEIGYPTDVKHVAHIGWDGPSSANGGGGGTENNGSKAEEAGNNNNSQASRSSRRQPSAGGSALNSEQQEGQRRSRRHHSTASTSSLPREGTSRGKNRQPRDGNLDSDSSSHHASDAPRKSRPKKPKDKDGKSEGSSRRAKSQASCDPGSDFSNNDISAGFEQRVSEDEKKCNEV